MRFRSQRRGRDGITEYLNAAYGGWADPIVILREFLRTEPAMAEANRRPTEQWFALRGLEIEWIRRLHAGAPNLPITTVEQPQSGWMSAPIVHGVVRDQDAWEPIKMRSDGGRFARVISASVVGGWDVIEMPEGAWWPALTRATEGRLLSNALERRLIGWTPNFLVTRPERVDYARVFESAIVLVGEHSTQFGHWMTDFIPRALAVRGITPDVPVIVDKGHADASRWWLERILGGRPVVSLSPGERIRINEAIVPLPRTFCPTGWPDAMPLTADVWASDPWAAAQMQLAAVDILDQPSRGNRRVWLGRRGGSKPLTNHDELAAHAAARYGFDVIYPEDLAVDDLVAVLCTAAIVVAPIGSQLFNLLLVRPGIRVLVLLGDAVMQARGGVVPYATAAGHQVALLRGKSLGAAPTTPYEARQGPYAIEQSDLDDALHQYKLV